MTESEARNGPEAAWQKAFEDVCDHARRSAAIGSVESLLGWDEQTMMPARASDHRADQAAAIAGLLHAHRTDRAHGDRLACLAEGPAGTGDSEIAATIRRLHDDFRKQSRLPARLVEEIARTCVRAQAAWVEARKRSDWSLLEPWIGRVMALKREQGTCQLTDRDPYDALMDDYEPAARGSRIAERFGRLREQIVPLVRAIADAPRRPLDDVVHRHYPRPAQEAFVRRIASGIGFDFGRGRLDTSEHPFCSTIGPHDCRITTRWDEHDLFTAVYGVLHEAGHGLYEQGLRPEWFGLPPGEAASLAVHESQSRFWENMVGRSAGFWEWCLPIAREAFPESLGDVTARQLHEATLVVRPSFIRVEADEVTYNLHVMLRFDLERAMIRGELQVADLRDAWNERFAADLGLRIDRDVDGVVQDVHWPAGLVGYFPTYTLGSMHAAQLMTAVRRRLGDIDGLVRRGEFSPVLDWLRTNVHLRGRLLESDAVMEAATGEPPSERHLVESLWHRYGPAHGLPSRPW